MAEELQRTWAEIDLDALAHNYHTLRRQAGEQARFLGVVKANAYGCGAIQVARKLETLGANYLAVACFDEARELRDAGISLPILILGYTPPEMTAELLRCRVTQAVSSEADAAEYSRRAAECGETLKIHIKADTGMTRLGFSLRGDFFDGGYPYSEGLFECVNKYIVLSCFYSGRYKTVREALRAFIRQYFCCDGEDMLLAMEKMQHNTKKEPVQTATQEQQFRVEAAPEQIDFIWEVFEKYNRILPEKITSHYMFRIFYLRSLIDYELLHNDGLLSRSEKARNALLELEEIYHTSEKSCEYLRPPVDFKT